MGGGDNLCGDRLDVLESPAGVSEHAYSSGILLWPQQRWRLQCHTCGPAAKYWDVGSCVGGNQRRRGGFGEDSLREDLTGISGGALWRCAWLIPRVRYHSA